MSFGVAKSQEVKDALAVLVKNRIPIEELKVLMAVSAMSLLGTKKEVAATLGVARNTLDDLLSKSAVKFERRMIPSSSDTYEVTP